MTRTTKCLLVLGAIALGAACGKKADDDAAADAGAATPPPATDAGGGATGEIASYPGQVPQGGTKVTRVSFTIHQAADPNSPVVSRIGPGTIINLKASYSSWMLIEYPSGVAQLSPGWINLDRQDSTKVADAPQDAGIKDAAPDVVDAAAAATDAAADGKSTRPIIKIKPPEPKPEPKKDPPKKK